MLKSCCSCYYYYYTTLCPRFKYNIKVMIEELKLFLLHSFILRLFRQPFGLFANKRGWSGSSVGIRCLGSNLVSGMLFFPVYSTCLQDQLFFYCNMVQSSNSAVLLWRRIVKPLIPVGSGKMAVLQHCMIKYRKVCNEHFQTLEFVSH